MSERFGNGKLGIQPVEINADLLQGQPIHLRQNVTLQVCYQPGQSPALVFLHGGLGNRYNWRSQYEFFHSQGYTVLAYDLAGHGQSSVYSRYSIGRHCRDLSRLLQRLQICKPILCCHSYGVPIGLEWAHQHPVSGLVLIGGGTHDLDPWWEVPLMKFMSWGGRYLYHLPNLQQLTNRLSSVHRHRTIEQFFAESPVPTTLHPYQALKIFWGYNFFDRCKSSYYVAKHSKEHYKRRDSKTFKKIKIPTLVISGEYDTMFTQEMATRLAAIFVPSQHLHLPQAGHLLMAECPDVVNQAISNWIVEVRSQEAEGRRQKSGEGV